MKLPNDLIKATDYSKAKDREIHEFEYKNGKYIHNYVLGGEHELTPQEIVDCLNGLATIDCDLQTAYAYIKGQDAKITDLEAKLAEKDKTVTKYQILDDNYARLEEKYDLLESKHEMLIEDNLKYEQQLAEKEKTMQGLIEAQKYLERLCSYQVFLDIQEENQQLKEQLEEKEKSLEYFRDRVDKADKEIKEMYGKYNEAVEDYNNLKEEVEVNFVDGKVCDQAKTEFAIEKLEKVKELCIKDITICEDYFAIEKILDQQIKELKEG